MPARPDDDLVLLRHIGRHGWATSSDDVALNDRPEATLLCKVGLLGPQLIKDNTIGVYVCFLRVGAAKQNLWGQPSRVINNTCACNDMVSNDKLRSYVCVCVCVSVRSSVWISSE